MHPRSLSSLTKHLERLSRTAIHWRFWQARWRSNASGRCCSKVLAIATARGAPTQPSIRCDVEGCWWFKRSISTGCGHGVRDQRWHELDAFFFGFDLGGQKPDQNTIRHDRNGLTASGMREALMQAAQQQLREEGYLGDGRSDRRCHAGACAQADPMGWMTV